VIGARCAVLADRLLIGDCALVPADEDTETEAEAEAEDDTCDEDNKDGNEEDSVGTELDVADVVNPWSTRLLAPLSFYKHVSGVKKERIACKYLCK
jgi:hypothetical protein